jgi:phage/plasmid-associated DNA primase
MAYLVSILREETGLRKLVAPPEVMEYTSEYRNENDGIAKFIADHIKIVEAGDQLEPVMKQELKRAFKTWKDQNDQKTLSPVDLEKRMETLFGKYSRNGWTNVRLES